jgi:hypothetical protein
MTSRSATIISFGNNHFIWQQQSQNALRVCKFRNKMADQHDEVRNSILTNLETLLNDVTAATSSDPEPHIIDHIHHCSEAFYQCFAVLSAQDPNTYSRYLIQARRLVDIMERSVFNGENDEPRTATRMPVLITPGRPKFHICRDQLVYLIEHNFSAVSIANMFDISLSTVRRRMREQGLSSTQQFASLSDEELDSIVSEIKLSHPQCGYRMVIGHLRSRGLKIQQDRVRTSLRRVDPEGTTVRWMAAIYRRKYSVKGPNSLWHIDGYHKLIR